MLRFPVNSLRSGRVILKNVIRSVLSCSIYIILVMQWILFMSKESDTPVNKIYTGEKQLYIIRLVLF